jgi:hypothetical protein
MRYLPILIGMLLWGNQSFSQSGDTSSGIDRIRIYSGFRFGFGGATQSNTFVGRETVKMVINPTMGGVAWIRFRQNFGLMAEAQYSLKGYGFKNSAGDTTIITRQRYHFFEFPLLIHASIGDHRFTEFIEIGMAPAFLSGGYRETSMYYDDQTIGAEYDKLIFNKPFPYPVRRFDMSIILGAGLGVRFGPGILHSGVRMNFGLTDIYKEERFGYDGDPQRQRNFYLHFGYLWHIHSIR